MNLSMRTISEWNNLPVYIRNITSYEEFKLTQKRWLLSMLPASERNRVKLLGGGGPYLKLLARLNKGLAHDLSS